MKCKWLCCCKDFCFPLFLNGSTMRPEVIDLGESSSDSSSVNGDNNVLNEQQAPCGVMTEKASQLRESLKNKGWIEVDAENVKDDIDRIYASEGEVWIYKSKGINPEKAAIKGKVICVIEFETW